MKKLTLAVALLGAAGLLAACGGEGSGSEAAPEDGNALTDPMKKVEGVAGDLEKKADEANDAMAAERTVKLSVSGMT